MNWEPCPLCRNPMTKSFGPSVLYRDTGIPIGWQRQDRRETNTDGTAQRWGMIYSPSFHQVCLACQIDGSVEKYRTEWFDRNPEPEDGGWGEWVPMGAPKCTLDEGYIAEPKPKVKDTSYLVWEIVLALAVIGVIVGAITGWVMLR